MQTNTNNPKYEFIKQYLQKEKNLAYEDALIQVEILFEELPKKKREKWQRLYEDIMENSANALETQLKHIANCPYIKIEISSQPEQDKILKDVAYIKDLLLFSSGYFESSTSKINKIEECLAEVIQNAKKG